jgi:hypothetical protein
LNSAKLFLSQMIWLRMDSYRIYRALEPYTINGKPISRLVDPHPVGIFGNYLAVRWAFGRDNAGAAERKKFEGDYLQQDDTSVEKATIALPTSGVFAEAILGRGEAAEVVDLDRFGKWGENQPPILPPNIGDLTSRDRAKTVDLSTGDFANALAALRSSPLADASHFGPIIDAVTKGDMFRNMGGLDKALVLAEKVAALSEKGATRAGDRNAEMQAKFLDTFVAVLDSDIGKAAVAEFMLPGAGPVLLQEYAKRPAVAAPARTPAAKPAPAKLTQGAAAGDGAAAAGDGAVAPAARNAGSPPAGQALPTAPAHPEEYQ